MVRSKSTTNKGINAKRIQEIVNYDLSLGMLVNPNIKQQLVLNPIGVKVALKTLKELREELEGLDKDFSREQRQKLADDLEEEIKKEYRKIETIGKINKTLRRASEAKISELSSELRDILSTLEVPTEEYINNRLDAIAEFKLREIKNRLDYKISYLSQVMEEIE